MSSPIALISNVTETGWDWIQAPYDLAPLYDTQLASKKRLGAPGLLLSQRWSGLSPMQRHESTHWSRTMSFTFSSSVTRESVAGWIFFGGRTPCRLSRQKIIDSAVNESFLIRTNSAWPILSIPRERSCLKVSFIDRSLRCF